MVNVIVNYFNILIAEQFSLKVVFCPVEAKRRESEGHTSASETEGEPRSHAAGIKSPLAQESPLKTASAPSETDAPGVTPQRSADEPAKPIEAEKGQGDSELPSHQQRVDSALEKIASKSESQAASVPVPPESNVKVDQSQVAVTEDGKQAQEKNKSEAGGETDVAIKKSQAGTDDSPTKPKSSVESSPRTTRTSVAIAAGKLPEPAVSPKRPARRSKEAEAVGSDSDKLAEDTAPADIVTKADKTDIEVDETDAKTDKTSTKTDERSEVVKEEPEATAATPQSVSDLKSDTTEEPAKAEEPVCEEPVVKESMDSIEKTAPCADTDGKQEEKMDEGSPVKDAVKDEGMRMFVHDLQFFIIVTVYLRIRYRTRNFTCKDTWKLKFLRAYKAKHSCRHTCKGTFQHTAYSHLHFWDFHCAIYVVQTLDTRMNTLLVL